MDQVLENYNQGLTLFRSCLKEYENIPAQNYSLLDKSNMETLQNGVLALENLMVKYANFCKTGIEEDNSLENKAVQKAIHLAFSLSPESIEKTDELEDNSNTVKAMGNEKSEMNTFNPTCNIDNNELNKFIVTNKGDSSINTPEPLINDQTGMEINSNKVVGDHGQGTEINEGKPIVRGDESINSFKPIVNNSSIDSVLQAFSSSINNSLENFSGLFYLGDKSYSSDIGKWIKKGSTELDKKPIDRYTADLISTAITGGIAGAAVDMALSALTRRLSYDDYAENCRNKGVEPLSKDAYTIGTVNHLKTSLMRGGAIGAGVNMIAKGGKEAALGFRLGVSPASMPLANFSNDKNEVLFSLTGQDLDDMINYSSIKALNEMKYRYDNSIKTINFSDWLNGRPAEYLQVLEGYFSQTLEKVIKGSVEECNFAFLAAADQKRLGKSNATEGDAYRGALLGAAIGGIGGGALAAMKKNKLYDAYAAGERAQGREPISRAKWVLLSDEVKKSAGLGLLGGGVLGAGINVARKNNGSFTGITGGNNDSSWSDNSEDSNNSGGGKRKDIQNPLDNIRKLNESFLTRLKEAKGKGDQAGVESAIKSYNLAFDKLTKTKSLSKAYLNNKAMEIKIDTSKILLDDKDSSKNIVHNNKLFNELLGEINTKNQLAEKYGKSLTKNNEAINSRLKSAKDKAKSLRFRDDVSDKTKKNLNDDNQALQEVMARIKDSTNFEKLHEDIERTLNKYPNAHRASKILNNIELKSDQFERSRPALARNLNTMSRKQLHEKGYVIVDKNNNHLSMNKGKSHFIVGSILKNNPGYIIKQMLPNGVIIPVRSGSNGDFKTIKAEFLKNVENGYKEFINKISPYLVGFSNLYGYIPENTDPRFLHYCFSLIRKGKLSENFLQTINFSKKKEQSSLINSVYQQYFNDTVYEDTIYEDTIYEDGPIYEDTVYEDTVYEEPQYIKKGTDDTKVGYWLNGKEVPEGDFEKAINDYNNRVKLKKAAITAGTLGVGGLGGALINNQVNKRKKNRNFSYTKKQKNQIFKDALNLLSENYVEANKELSKPGSINKKRELSKKIEKYLAYAGY